MLRDNYAEDIPINLRIFSLMDACLRMVDSCFFYLLLAHNGRRNCYGKCQTLYPSGIHGWLTLPTHSVISSLIIRGNVPQALKNSFSLIDIRLFLNENNSSSFSSTRLHSARERKTSF